MGNGDNWVSHIAGAKHQSKLRNSSSPADLFCRPCARQIDSKANFLAHCSSKAHIQRLAQLGVAPPPPTAPPTVAVRRVVMNYDFDDDDGEWAMTPSALPPPRPTVAQPPPQRAATPIATPPLQRQPVAPISHSPDVMVTRPAIAAVIRPPQQRQPAAPSSFALAPCVIQLLRNQSLNFLSQSSLPQSQHLFLSSELGHLLLLRISAQCSQHHVQRDILICRLALCCSPLHRETLQ